MLNLYSRPVFYGLMQGDFVSIGFAAYSILNGHDLHGYHLVWLYLPGIVETAINLYYLTTLGGWCGLASIKRVIYYGIRDIVGYLYISFGSRAFFE